MEETNEVRVGRSAADLRLTKGSSGKPRAPLSEAYLAMGVDPVSPRLDPLPLGEPEKRKALRFNEGKSEIHYILFYKRVLEAFAKVQSQGAVKYGYGNWMQGGKPDAEYWDAGMRHMIQHFAATKGLIDPKTGEPTSFYDKDIGVLVIAQAIWNFFQLIELNLDMDIFDPEFDQDGFVERWKDYPKENAFER